MTSKCTKRVDVERLIDMLDDSACRCHEAYKSRGITDPNCNHEDAETVADLRAVVADMRSKLVEQAAEIEQLKLEGVSCSGCPYVEPCE